MPTVHAGRLGLRMEPVLDKALIYIYMYICNRSPVVMQAPVDLSRLHLSFSKNVFFSLELCMSLIQQVWAYTPPRGFRSCSCSNMHRMKKKIRSEPTHISIRSRTGSISGLQKLPAWGSVASKAETSGLLPPLSPCWLPPSFDPPPNF